MTVNIQIPKARIPLWPSYFPQKDATKQQVSKFLIISIRTYPVVIMTMLCSCLQLWSIILIIPVLSPYIKSIKPCKYIFYSISKSYHYNVLNKYAKYALFIISRYPEIIYQMLIWTFGPENRTLQHKFLYHLVITTF